MLNKLVMQSMQRNASAILAARPCTPMPLCNSSRTFTKAFRKVVLREDVEHLGFRGEVCFVKPGRALNDLVPSGDAYFFTDRRATVFMDTVVVSANSFYLFVNQAIEFYRPTSYAGNKKSASSRCSCRS